MSWFADLVSLPYNAVTGNQTQMQKDAALMEGQTQIQGVADNAKAYYDAHVAAVSQDAANAQSIALAKDQAALNKANEQCSGVNLSGIGLGCINSFSEFLAQLNTAVKIGLAIVAVVAVGYVFLLVAPFLPKGKK